MIMTKTARIIVKSMFALMVLVVATVYALPCQASLKEKEYLEAVQHYNNGDYRNAAALFENIAGEKVVNGKLYYNAGNAFYKSGNIGRSILWYERALKLIPGDPDLIFNYNFVNGLVMDKAEDKTNPLINVMFFWKKKLAHRTLTFLAVSFFLLFVILYLIRIIKPVNVLKYPERVFLGLALVFILSSYHDYYEKQFNGKAVVLSDSVSVRSGLSDDSTELFRLHEGTKVSVDERLRGYVKIRFSDDKIGWVKINDIEII